MEHSFDIHLAKEIGLEESIMMKHFIFWISKNKHNKINNHEGRTWSYNSVSAFDGLFPYFTKKQIRRILKSLLDQGLIIEGNYNKAKYDRTKWYAIVDESSFVDMGKWNCPKGKMDLPKKENAIAQTDKPIPYILPNNNTDINTIYKSSIDLYNDFCLNRFDAPAKIDGVQGKAMKSIIKYLKSVSKKKGSDPDQGVLDSLKYIFSSWDSLEPFLQKQVKLSQINSNLVNIIQQIRNEKKSNNIAQEIIAKYQ